MDFYRFHLNTGVQKITLQRTVRVYYFASCLKELNWPLEYIFSRRDSFIFQMDLNVNIKLRNKC